MSEQPTPQRETISWEQALQRKEGGDAPAPVTGVEVGAPTEVPLVDATVATPDPVPHVEVTEMITTPEAATTEVLHVGEEEGGLATQEPGPTLEVLPQGEAQPVSVVTAEEGIVPDLAPEIKAAVGDPSEENLVALSRAAHQ